MTKEKNQKQNLSRCYATILYPESAAENWMDILENLHTKIMISPLHDQDTDNEGLLKKPHRHILFHFPSVKSQNQIKEITDKIHSVGQERVIDPMSMALYLIHRNAPDKAQYSPDDVICFNCNYMEYILKGQDASSLIGDIIDYIEDQNVRSFATLIQYCRKHQQEWLHIIYGRTYFFTAYLKSRKWNSPIRQKEELINPIFPD